MSVLNVVALIAAKPGSEELVRSSLAALAVETLKEEGCRKYELFASAATPGTFVTIEEWASQADFDGHMASPHLAAALGATTEALATPPAIHTLLPA